jgi:hypothetical protein
MDPTSRALRVPFMESTSGHSRLTMASRNPCSAALSCPRRVVPKLTTKFLGASGAPPLWDDPKLAMEVVIHEMARVSHRVGANGVADQDQGSMSFSRRVSPMDTPAPRSASRQARRRDGIPAPRPTVLRQAKTRVCH